MTELIWDLTKAHLALAGLYVAFKLTCPKKPDFRLNRALLLSIPLLALLAGFVNWPVLNNPVFQSPEVYLETLQVKPDGSPNPGFAIPFSPLQLLVYGYLAGSLFTLLMGCRQLFKLFHLISRSPKSRKTSYTLVETAHLPVFSFFHYLFWNEAQASNEQEKAWMFRHELAHIQQKHTLDLLLTGFLKCIFWFNPVIYRLEKDIQLNLEFLADQAAIAYEANAGAYGECLLSKRFETSNLGISHHFNRSQIQKRIAMMTTKDQNNRKQGWYPAIVLSLFTVLMITAFACTEQKEMLSEQEREKQEKKTSKEGVVKMSQLNQDPEFKGGKDALFRYIRDEVNYPESAEKDGKSGTPVVNFMIDKNGEVKEAKVARSANIESLDQEALRVVSEMPDWKPGEKDGEAVKVRMNLPIKFQSKNSNE